jgi:hypothetical protein
MQGRRVVTPRLIRPDPTTATVLSSNCTFIVPCPPLRLLPGLLLLLLLLLLLPLRLMPSMLLLLPLLLLSYPAIAYSSSLAPHCDCYQGHCSYCYCCYCCHAYPPFSIRPSKSILHPIQPPPNRLLKQRCIGLHPRSFNNGPSDGYLMTRSQSQCEKGHPLCHALTSTCNFAPFHFAWSWFVIKTARDHAVTQTLNFVAVDLSASLSALHSQRSFAP